VYLVTQGETTKTLCNGSQLLIAAEISTQYEAGKHYTVMLENTAHSTQ
jgi:hypothetical protein